MNFDALRMVALTGVLFSIGCAAQPEEGAASEEAALESPAQSCVGVRLELSWNDHVEAAALATFDDRFVLPEADYSTRVKIPGALSIIHKGDFASGKIALFGAPKVWSSASTLVLSVDGPDVIGGSTSGGGVAKAIYDAMTKVETKTLPSSAGSTYLRRASADGTFECTRRIEGDADRSYSCSIDALKTTAGTQLRLDTLQTCSE